MKLSNASLGGPSSIPSGLSATGGLLLIIAGMLLYRAFSDVYLSRLSMFPGPLLASITNGWKALKVKCGTLTDDLRSMHQSTGQPILRIGPNHLSFWDPDAYKEIYIRNRFPKEGSFYGAFQIPSNCPNTFSTPDPALNAPRRRQASTSLSRQSVIALEQLFHEQLAIYADRLTEVVEHDGTVNIFDAFRCLTSDVIATFAFGMSFQAMSAKNFEAAPLVALDTYLSGGYMRLHFPQIVRYLTCLPIFMQPRWQRGYGQFIQLGHQALRSYRSSNAEHKYPVLFAVAKHLGSESPLSDDQLISEANLYIGAGGDTTGVTLSVGSWYIARNEAVYQRLFAEVQAHYPEKNDVMHAHWADLEKLPYLSACIHESLRMASPVPGDLPRVVTGGDWEFKGLRIPEGTVVSSSAIAVHFNKGIFPDPFAFRPERWLNDDGSFSNALEPWLVSFTKGPRACLGQTFAMAELYIFMAAFIRIFDVEILDNSERIEMLDFFTSTPKNHDQINGRIQLSAE